jgi:hypothetical protein
MKIDTQANVDACIEFIEAKNCYYLAKEGQIVYFASMTGREQDKDWIKLSVQEFMRIMSATKLPHDTVLMTADVIQAFQEADRVYEFGMSSQYGTADGIFNYSEQGGINILSAVCISLTDVLMARDVTALTSGLALIMIRDVLAKVDSKVIWNIAEVKESMLKYFTGVGYDYRAGSRRPLVNGTKQTVLMMSGTKPKDVVTYMNYMNIDSTISEVYRRVK